MIKPKHRFIENDSQSDRDFSKDRGRAIETEKSKTKKQRNAAILSSLTCRSVFTLCATFFDATVGLLQQSGYAYPRQ